MSDTALNAEETGSQSDRRSEVWGHAEYHENIKEGPQALQTGEIKEDFLKEVVAEKSQ